MRGLVLFGEGARVTVAHLVEPDSTLAAATAGLRQRVPDLRHPVWSPHVTLARLDGGAEGKLAAFVQSHNLFRADPVQVEHFTLFSSLLGKDQAVYTAEVEYPLGQPAKRE